MENLQNILEYLSDKKCKDVCIYDLSKEGQSFDYLIVLTMSNVATNKKFAYQIMQDFGIEKFPEGFNKGEWIVFDFGEIVVHSFIQQAREKYNLDKLWQLKKINSK